MPESTNNKIVKKNVHLTEAEELLDILDRDGVIILTNVLSEENTLKAVKFGQDIVKQALSKKEHYTTFDDYGKNESLLRAVNLQDSLTEAEFLLPVAMVPIIKAIFDRTGISYTLENTDATTSFQTAGMAAHILLSGATARPLHRDIEHLFNGVFTELPAYSVAMHIPVTSFNATTGATRILPGSHRMGSPVFSKSRIIFDKLAETVVAEPGDIILFDNRVWHASGTNLSDAPRVMLSVLYMAQWLGQAECKVSQDVYKQLPDIIKNSVSV